MNTDSKIYQLAIGPAIVTALILLIPLIAMEFSSQVLWTLSDFIIMSTLLFGTGFTYKLITRRSSATIYRIAIGFALLTGFLLIWVNLAVGIIGYSGSPASMLYFAVVLIGIIGAFAVRFKAEKMIFVMFAMGVVQALIAAMVLIGKMYSSPPETVFHIIGVNAFFITLFVVSALLFRYVAREQLSSNEKSVN